MNSKKTVTATSRENFTLTAAIPIDTPSHTLLEQEQKATSTNGTDIENAGLQDSIALFCKDFIANSHEDAPTTSADPSPVVTSKSGLEQAAHFDDDVYREVMRLLEWIERNKNARREELKWFDSIKNVRREELEWFDSMDNPARKIEQANYEGGCYLVRRNKAYESICRCVWKVDPDTDRHRNEH